jgi:hypothetical protein
VLIVLEAVVFIFSGGSLEASSAAGECDVAVGSRVRARRCGG